MARIPTVILNEVVMKTITDDGKAEKQKPGFPVSTENSMPAMTVYVQISFME